MHKNACGNKYWRGEEGNAFSARSNIVAYNTYVLDLGRQCTMTIGEPLQSRCSLLLTNVYNFYLTQFLLSHLHRSCSPDDQATRTHARIFLLYHNEFILFFYFFPFLTLANKRVFLRICIQTQYSTN